MSNARKRRHHRVAAREAIQKPMIAESIRAARGGKKLSRAVLALVSVNLLMQSAQLALTAIKFFSDRSDKE